MIYIHKTHERHERKRDPHKHKIKQKKHEIQLPHNSQTKDCHKNATASAEETNQEPNFLLQSINAYQLSKRTYKLIHQNVKGETTIMQFKAKRC